MLRNSSAAFDRTEAALEAGTGRGDSERRCEEGETDDAVGEGERLLGLGASRSRTKVSCREINQSSTWGLLERRSRRAGGEGWDTWLSEQSRGAQAGGPHLLLGRDGASRGCLVVAKDGEYVSGLE